MFDMDEGFYGAVVAEMNRRGEWITPYYNGHPWFEKPILLYWLAKPSMMLFGDWIGPRVPSLLATVGVYLLVAWFAKRRWDDQTARWCVLVTASSILVVGIGRMMMTDALLNLCLVGAFVFFWESLVGDRRWRLLSALFLGLSVLAKGPVGLPLFAIVAGWTYWREAELRPRFKGWWLAGIAVLAGTIATWYLPAYLANGHQFVDEFLIKQNLQRFTGGDPAHNTPIWSDPIYYPLVLMITMAPWVFYLRKAWPERTDTLGRYLVVWMLVPLIFFSISKAKLPHYALPCCVPIALLVGSYLARRESRAEVQRQSVRKLAYPMAMCGVVAVLINAVFLLYYNWGLLSGHAEVHALAFYVRAHAKTGEDVDSFQMPRRQHDLGTGRPRIQETSHPSLAMYLNRVINEPDTLEMLLDDPHPQWIITRANRISEREIDGARKVGRSLTQVLTSEKQDLYRLFYLDPAPETRTGR